MDLLRGDVRAIYRKYFLAAFGSTLISCVYGVVDMAMVGQYQGPDGTAALAVVAPVWNVIYSLGLLTGIGGSVLLSAKRGSGAAGQAEANEYFTTAVLASVLLPLNIFSMYYFQAILKPGAAFFVSVARGLVISGALILLLPAVLGPPRSGGPCRSRSCWSRAVPRRPCGARRGRCRRAKTGPVCIHSCYWG